MTAKKNARPIFILFVVCFLSIIVILYASMNWIDQQRSRASGGVSSGVTPVPDMYAPD
jgi:uncharacterized protein YggT (Ycf19 family)